MLATLINIGTQKTIEVFFINFFKFNFYIIEINFIKKVTYGLLLQMSIATIIAFIFKYLVDKIFIFKDKTKYISKTHFKKVFLYGSFAVITTLIFWFFELSFKYFFNFNNSHIVGAILGLAIGYTIKFLLDRKYVFDNYNN
jgi:putative flippase GtrA